jgi:hypothetical protein
MSAPEDFSWRAHADAFACTEGIISPVQEAGPIIADPALWNIDRFRR